MEKEELYRDINAKLLEAQIGWFNKIVITEDTRSKLSLPDRKKRDYDHLSFPFYFGVSQEYVNSSKKKIMIVGQETGSGFSFLNSEDGKTKEENAPIKSQEWTYTYNDKQWRGISANHSPFWGFVRSINAFNEYSSYITCYNNVDKIHFSRINPKTNNIDPLPLTYKAEEIFSSVYDFNGVKAPLLFREIQILKECNERSQLDGIVFVTGPYYDQTMGLALDLVKGKNTLKHYRPTEDEPIKDISEIVKLEGIKVFWTYHPNYLRLKQKEEQVLKALFERL